VRQADAVLREASRLRQRSAEEAQEAQRLRRAAEEDRQAAAAERRRLEEERAQLEAQAVAKAREIVRRARLKTQEAIDALREAQAGRRGAEQAIAAARSALREALPEAPGPAADPEPPLERVVVGQRVRLRGLAQEGRVVEAPDPAGKALVEVGSVRLRLPLAELCAPHGPLAEPFPPSGAVVHGAAAARQEVAPELDLRGLRVEEALDETERYLDRALLAGLERVRLIHGKGTGALRAAVGELLTRHPAVASHRLGGPGEGGDGVTVVELGG
jgi:DNA mismatch repair protein MutS2